MTMSSMSLLVCYTSNWPSVAQVQALLVLSECCVVNNGEKCNVNVCEYRVMY